MKIVDKRRSIRKHPTKKLTYRNTSGITTIAVHHSATLSGSAEAFANYHVGTNGWSCMGYAYVINKDGSVDWCADWNVVTPHVGKHNRYAIGICMVGDFRKQDPTPAQYQALLDLIRYLEKEIPSIKHIKGHQEFSGYEWKPCPSIDMNKVRTDVVKKEEKPVSNKKDYEGHWAESHIKSLISKGIVKGYPDGNFRPDEPVTRAQLAKVVDLTIKHIKG